MVPLSMLLQQLDALTPEEVKVVTGRLKAKEQFYGHVSTPAGTDPMQQMIFDAVHEVMRKAGQHISITQLRNGSQQALQEAVPVLQAWLRSSSLDRQQTRGILAMAVHFLLLSMRKASIPITGRTVLQQLDGIPSVFDEEFPGYAQAGLLGMIIRRES